jgi:hypothetical protein
MFYEMSASGALLPSLSQRYYSKRQYAHGQGARQTALTFNRKNALFAGHNVGAENWATIASLIETCKLNAVDPLAYLTATLTAIVNGHKQSRIECLFPWEYPLG